MPGSFHSLDSALQLRPVFMDIGATGEPPALWRELAPHAVYVGVGPAATPTGQSLIDSFHQAYMIEKIVTVEPVQEVSLNLMKNPIYSSLLVAHPQATTEFLDPRLAPDGHISLSAITVDAIIGDLRLPGIDWLHTNINGLDVPVFQSLSSDLRRTVLALDSCLDVVELYQGQQSSVARYPEMLEEGFWLSRTFTDGPIRISDRGISLLQRLDPSLDEGFVSKWHRRSPGWIYVRFLRTREWLAAQNVTRREYALLWAFALLDGQFGFCAELLVDYEERFGMDTALNIMQSETVKRLLARKPKPSFRRTIKRLLGR